MSFFGPAFPDDYQSWSAPDRIVSREETQAEDLAGELGNVRGQMLETHAELETRLNDLDRYIFEIGQACDCFYASSDTITEAKARLAKMQAALAALEA